MLTFDQRVSAVTAGLGRDIKTEALQQVAGSSSTTWFEAQQFGTALNRQLFTLQSKLMREAAKAFLASDRCSNSTEARPQYVLGLARSGGGWFFEEALWMAAYGTSCHISSSSSWRQQQHERARQQHEQAHRQQQREEARQQRREQARRQQDERAKQQRRQQQFQQGRQGAGLQAAAAELSAPEPDVSSMSEAELRALLETLGMSALVAHLDSAAPCKQGSSAAAGTAAGASSSMAVLLQLAQHCMPLWEAQRLVRCSKYMSSSRATACTREAVARMVFRLDVSSSSSSSSLQVREVRRGFRALALTVHPDKIPKVVQRVNGSQELFNEAFKALQQAHELLMHGCR